MGVCPGFRKLGGGDPGGLGIGEVNGGGSGRGLLVLLSSQEESSGFRVAMVVALENEEAVAATPVSDLGLATRFHRVLPKLTEEGAATATTASFELVPLLSAPCLREIAEETGIGTLEEGFSGPFVFIGLVLPGLVDVTQGTTPQSGLADVDGIVVNTGGLCPGGGVSCNISTVKQSKW